MVTGAPARSRRSAARDDEHRRPNPPVHARADARSLKDLIEAKERELSELGDYRVSSLEAAVKERDEKLRRLQATIGRLRDDFGYNLKLVEERDVGVAAPRKLFGVWKTGYEIAI